LERTSTIHDGACVSCEIAAHPIVTRGFVWCCQVTLQCGIGNTLSDVAEPATCKYTATLKTPAACSEVELESLQQQQQAAEVQA
jgi:hypothetical protein